MADVSQWLFTPKEVLEALIKCQDIHEGRWVLMINFGIGPGNFGPANDQMSPGVIVAANQIGIQRAAENTPLEMTLDAAVINPAKSVAKPSRPKSKKG